MESRCCGCCGSCCCVSRMGLVAYTGIFLGLGLLGLYHFAPVESANYALTFIMDDVVDDAEALCAGAFTCEYVCRDGDELIDMEAAASTLTGAQYFNFVISLLGLIIDGVGLTAALTYNANLIKHFIIATGVMMFLAVIALGTLSASDPKPVRRRRRLGARIPRL